MDDKYQSREELNKKRIAYARARAILLKAKKANIPDKYIRIKPDRFERLLCPYFHKDQKGFTNLIYSAPHNLFKQNFILIDGGNFYARKEAGFAVLFRMLACGKDGQHIECGRTATMFQSIRFGEEINRNDIVDNLKSEDVLFISEFNPKSFNPHFDSGIFFDQLLSYRDDHNLQTIVSFVQPLTSNNILRDDICGVYFASLTRFDNEENIFRIRVK